MIRFIYKENLESESKLMNSMYKDRAIQFKERLNWDVNVDAQGWETDEYDGLNPLYLICESPDGRHAGSMRVLPTTGRTMVNEHFRHLTNGVAISSPLIWECTRFCLSPAASPDVSAKLLVAACEAGLRFGVEQGLGVFDARMPKIYGRLGWSPDVIGASGKGRDAISIGIWTFTEQVRDEICRRSGISLAELASWFDASFGAARQNEPVAA